MQISQKHFAMLLVTLLTASITSGCIGDNDEKDEEETTGELKDWNLFHVQSSSELPDCNPDNEGKLYYISSEGSFMSCSIGTWSQIDLVGPPGPAGPAGTNGEVGQTGSQGPQGPQGPHGPEGEIGPQGMPGSDGTSFNVIGSVSQSSDLGEIYVGNSGDAFLVESSSHIYVWNGSSWVDLGNISGPRGQQGPQGLQGESGPQGNDGEDGQQGPDGSEGPPGSLPAVMEMTITVSSMKFYVENILQGDIVLYRGFTYSFDQSDSSNSPHPLRLSTTSDGTHDGGTEYVDGVTYTGTQGSSGLLTFSVPLDAPDDLYYYCQNHGSMGGSITIQSLGSVS